MGSLLIILACAARSREFYAFQNQMSWPTPLTRGEPCYNVSMLGLHLVFTTYGYWLPNDPRGSGSSEVRAQHLCEVGGDATKVETRHSVAGITLDKSLRLATKAVLKRPPVIFTGTQARAVGRGFCRIVERLGITVYACSIMPDHTHLVVGQYQLAGGKMIDALKRAATRRLNEESLHPFVDCPRSNCKLPSPWAAGGWKVFLYTNEDIERTIVYVENNPIRAGFNKQNWSFVKNYDL